MNRELKQKWVEALRSGEYLQAQERLKSEEWDEETEKPTGKESYCCLGVLLDIWGEGRWEDFEYAYTDSIGDTCYVDTELNTDLLEEIGLGYSIQNKLIEMNDTENLSFNEIAGYIEQNL